MKPEAKVGLLFLGSVILVVIFSYYLGVLSPFAKTHSLDVMYNYAGGIETGSPVRVMGIKVGKVRSISFDPFFKMENGEEVKLRIKIDIEREAWTSVRSDSRFFINLAGVIGEKFLEISPGSINSAELQPGQVVRGEDPPRIDQLISQSYGLAGKFLEIVNKNEGSLTSALDQMDKLVTNINKTLALVDKAAGNPEVDRTLKNAVKISDDLAYLTGQLRGKKAEETYELVYKLLFRLEDFDGPAIRKFLQEEGIKARLF